MTPRRATPSGLGSARRTGLGALSRTFRPGINAALIVCAGALLVGAGVSSVRAHFEAKHAREAICAARVEAVVARNPYARRYVLPVDPCLALEVVSR